MCKLLTTKVKMGEVEMTVNRHFEANGFEVMESLKGSLASVVENAIKSREVEHLEGGTEKLHNEPFDVDPIQQCDGIRVQDIICIQGYKALKPAFCIKTNKVKELEEVSSKQQKENCKAFCETNQWGIPSFYEKSSKGRIDVSQLIKDVQEGKVDILIVNSLPIISRNSKELLRLKSVLDEYGVQFIVIDGSINTLVDIESTVFNITVGKEVA